MGLFIFFFVVGVIAGLLCLGSVSEKSPGAAWFFGVFSVLFFLLATAVAHDNGYGNIPSVTIDYI